MHRKIFAFFDVDETIINIKSMFSFRDFYLKKIYGNDAGEIRITKAQAAIQELIAAGGERRDVNRIFFQTFAGHEQRSLILAVEDWYQVVRNQSNFFIQSCFRELRAHQNNGVTPVFVSGSSQEILAPLARELNVIHVLANNLEVTSGKYSGNILSPQTIGDGKRVAIVGFLKEWKSDPNDCYGYGDHISDLPLLESVGFPVVIARDPTLITIARERGWRMLLV
ncbi:MAG: HAD family hydrolase [Alcaligenes sp.]